MTKEIIVRKRYPRGFTRKRYTKDGKELPCTYVDVGRLLLQSKKGKNWIDLDKNIKTS